MSSSEIVLSIFGVCRKLIDGLHFTDMLMHLFNTCASVFVFLVNLHSSNFNNANPANCLPSAAANCDAAFICLHTHIHKFVYVCEVCILTANNFHLICLCCRCCNVALPDRPPPPVLPRTMGKIVNKGKGGKTVPRARFV